MDARKRTELGFRNFCGVWQLHYPVGKYLCKDGETCYLTNLAKAAVGTGFPGAGNEEKYEAWYPLLEKELGLVAKPDAKIISVGGKVGSFLSKKGLYGHVGTIPHYSGQAAGQPGPGDTRQGGGVREVQVETGSHTQLNPQALPLLRHGTRGPGSHADCNRGQDAVRLQGAVRTHQATGTDRVATATAGMATPVDGNVGNCSGRTSQVRSPCRESASEFDTLTNPLWMARRFQGSAHVASRGAGRRLEPLLKRGQLAGGPRHRPRRRAGRPAPRGGDAGDGQGSGGTGGRPAEDWFRVAPRDRIGCLADTSSTPGV